METIPNGHKQMDTTFRDGVLCFLGSCTESEINNPWAAHSAAGKLEPKLASS